MSARRFRKRPLVVEAVQFDGLNFDEMAEFTGGQFRRRLIGPMLAEVYDVLHDTWVGVAGGHWVIRGTRGEFYPVEPSALWDTYDDVTEESVS